MEHQAVTIPDPHRPVAIPPPVSLRWGTAVIYGLFLSAIFGILLFNVYVVKSATPLLFGIYGTLMLSYLLGKMGLSFFYKPVTGDPPDVRVSVIVPGYNEGVDEVQRTLHSVLAQDYPLAEVFYVDDGSKTLDGYEAALEIARGDARLKVHRFDRNSGKRAAQAWAFRQATGEVFVTVDSDTVLATNAVRELLKPLKDERVMAVTGHIMARNRDANLLTRFIDMRYHNAFRVERASQSMTGTVLCCSGPLSAYRRDVVMSNLDNYETQTFLGRAVQFGDDRRLTKYALEAGRTVYQETACAWTTVPTSLRKFLKQQERWSKSFFRESGASLKSAIDHRQPVIATWVALELALQLVFTLMLASGVLPKLAFVSPVVLLYYLAYISLATWARNVHYVTASPMMLVLAPLYGIFHMTVLLPTRWYALLTIRGAGWGTR